MMTHGRELLNKKNFLFVTLNPMFFPVLACLMPPPCVFIITRGPNIPQLLSTMIMALISGAYSLNTIKAQLKAPPFLSAALLFLKLSMSDYVFVI